MSVKLLTEHNFEFLSLKGDWTDSSESILVKMPHCWKSRHGSYYVVKCWNGQQVIYLLGLLVEFSKLVGLLIMSYNSKSYIDTCDMLRFVATKLAERH